MRYYEDEAQEGQTWEGWDDETGEGNPALSENLPERSEPHE